jgi:Zn-dependent protease
MQYLFLLPGLVIGLTIHEAAHAITAKWLGDHLAWREGRVSLNPLRHLSLWGTLALFILGFGWGKPVPVNLYNFKHPKRDYLLTSLAGPASNLLMCAVAWAVLSLDVNRWLEFLLISVFMINGILAAINLIPIPPLDGSKIWPCLIPGMRPVHSGKMSQVWFVVLIVGLYSGAIGRVMGPYTQWLSSLVDRAIVTPIVQIERPADLPEVFRVPTDACDVEY